MVTRDSDKGSGGGYNEPDEDLAQPPHFDEHEHLVWGLGFRV